MGHYTDFAVKIIKGNVDKKEFQILFEQITGYKLYNWTLDNVKWYSWSEDMLFISTKFPAVVFQLEGIDKEEGDRWRVYFKNGKQQSANTEVKVIHEEFDESKLE